MTLTKAHIFEAVAKQNGYPKNQSSGMIATILEIKKKLWNPERMFWLVTSESLV